jgi:hypothetical protein
LCFYAWGKIGDKMTDIVLKIRLRIDDKNKKLVSRFSEWLNREYPKPSYDDCATEFVKKILEVSELPFEGTMEISHSEEKDWMTDFRHPKLRKDQKWTLDDILLRNKTNIWIKLENQWIRGKVEIKDKKSYVVIEPENIPIQVTEALFLRW